jgi:RNA polymerase sigma-54 factor
LEQTPALVEGILTNMNDPVEEYPDKDPDDDFNMEENSYEDEFSVDEYIQEDDYKDYGGGYDHDDEDGKKEIPIAVQDSFYENLQNQLDLLALSDKDYIVGQQIIGSLDDDGYLRRPILSLIDDLAFSQCYCGRRRRRRNAQDCSII